jgi:site-specific DNA-methyltransferase (adenine-specific)/site-specific DNA-methyltransferase (cytosine-N4-specific)
MKAGYQFLQGDAARLPFADSHFDLVFCSPPYEDARMYGIDFDLAGKDWVDWAVTRFLESLRVCKGLVGWVVNGRTHQHQWSTTPTMLMAELQRHGVCLRKPPIFRRNGIPGSGSRDWLRDDYEFIVVATKQPGPLPWSDNTAMGSPPKYKRGGRFSNRTKDGERADGAYPSELKLANPGNVIDCVVGGGHMGHELAHENEAPFPEALADFFIRSFCPPGGIVLDPFSGSGTTVAAAVKAGRYGVGIDIRPSQVDLGNRRLDQVVAQLGLQHGAPGNGSEEQSQSNPAA